MAKGIRRYQPVELANLSFNNLGTEIIVRPYGLSIPHFTRFLPPDGMVFTAIVCLNGVGKITARTIAGHPGDDLAADGTYVYPPSNSNNMFLMKSADIAFGRFDEIAIWQDEVASDHAYFKTILVGK